MWNNQQVVHVFVPGQHEPWATVYTKRLQSVDLVLTGPKGKFALGRITELAADREFQAGSSRDSIKLRFTTTDDSGRGDLRAFLIEHLESAAANGANGASKVKSAVNS